MDLGGQILVPAFRRNEMFNNKALFIVLLHDGERS